MDPAAIAVYDNTKKMLILINRPPAESLFKDSDTDLWGLNPLRVLPHRRMRSSFVLQKLRIIMVIYLFSITLSTLLHYFETQSFI